MVPTLIVPLVGSVESVHALPFARAAAQTFGGRLVLLRAVPHQHPHVSRADREHMMLELEGLARELRKEGIAAEAQIRRAEPAVAIVDAVREHDASVIVRSSYERHDLAGWLRGTIIDEATHQIHIPVLIVPAAGAPAPAPGSRLRVLVPLDGSALAESALVHVVGIAKIRPLEVYLVDVVRLRLGPFGAVLPSVPGPEAERRVTTRYLHAIAATLRAAGVATHTDVIKSKDSVARVLLDLARRSVVDIIVMATRSRSALAHVPPGSVATEVLDRSPIPVLLVPHPSRMEPPGHARETGSPAVAQVVQP